MSTPVNPFRGLEPYGENDRLYGRDSDLVLIKDRIFRGRTTLLFAGSGVGKTSFFQAKLIPEITRRYPGQFRIAFHSRWTEQDPLTALRQTLGVASGQSLRALFNRTDAATAGSHIVVLDQFEEALQYYLYRPLFTKFRDELCDVINDQSLPLQVVFSMREEFLGQLSTFDNRIPDLFGNYYRLRNPDKLQTEEIIERTATAAGVSVDEEGLRTLVEDLSRIEVWGGSENSRKRFESLQRDYVVPPHLQLVCHKLWDAEAAAAREGSKGQFVFLADYLKRKRSGKDPARQMLVAFCQDAMDGFSPEQQRVSARAFDFLVTRHGAKVPYELKSLALHAVEPQKLLRTTLDELTCVRILRKFRRPQEEWYELYHDMYAPIIFEWKERFETRRRREQRLELQAAGFQRRAIDAESRDNRDEALIYWLKALEIRDTPDRRLQAGRLTSELVGMKQTFRHEGPPIIGRLSPDEKILLTALTHTRGETGAHTKAFQEVYLQTWKTDSGEPTHRPALLNGRLVDVDLCGNSRIAVLMKTNLCIVDCESGKTLLEHPAPDDAFSVLVDATGRFAIVISRNHRQRWTTFALDSSHTTRSSKAFKEIIVDRNGKYVLTRSTGLVRLHHAIPTTPAGPPLRIDGDATAMALGPNGLVAVGFGTGSVRLWNGLTGEVFSSFTSSGGAVSQIAFTKNGGKLLIAHGTGDTSDVRTRDVKAETELERLLLAQTGPLTFSSDGRRVMTYWWDTQAVDIHSGRPLEAPWRSDGLRPWVGSATDGTLLLSADEFGRVRSWQPTELQRPEYPIWDPSGFSQASVDFACTRLALAKADGSVQIWKIDDGPSPGHAIRSHGFVLQLAMHPVLPCLATLDGHAVLDIWSADKGTKLQTRKQFGVSGFLFNPVAPCLLLYGERSLSRLWWFGKKQVSITIPGRTTLASFSRDGRLLALGRRQSVLVVDARKGKPLREIKAARGATLIAFSPDGKLLASVGDDATVRLWKSPSWTLAGELPHHGPIIRLAFSPKGSYIATAGAEQLLRVWDTARIREACRFRHGSEIFELDFSGDEQTLMVATQTRLHLFDIGSELMPRGSRGLGGRWLSSYSILDEHANSIRVAVSSSQWGIQVKLLQFDTVAAKLLEGRPKTLLSRWQNRLALRLEAEEVVPSSLLRVTQPPPASDPTRAPLSRENVPPSTETVERPTPTAPLGVIAPITNS